MSSSRWGLVVLVLVLVLHVQILGGPLIFDDLHAVVQNTAIRSLSNIPAFFLDPDLFSASAGRMYRPLVLTTLAIDRAIGGGAPWAFKLGNLLQHVAVCALLLASLPRLFARAGLGPAAAVRATWIAVLLFGLHPLHVETLCLVSSRSEILCAIGFLVALQGFLRAGDAGCRGRQGLWLAGGTAIASLSKETGVLVPLVVLLADLLLPGRGATGRPRDGRGWVLRAGPAVSVAAAYLVLRKSLFGVATLSLRALSTGGDPWSGGSRDLATQLAAMALYLPQSVALWVFPVPLALDHTRFYGLGFGSVPVLAGAGFVAGSLLAAAWVRKRRPLVTLSAWGAAAFALPWILVPLNVPFAEHRLYLPVLLFTLPAAAWVARVHSPAVLVRPGLVSVLALLALRSNLQQHAWRSLGSIWAATLRWNPTSFRAWTGLGDAAIERGDLWQAVRCLEKAHALYPRYGPAAQNLREMRVRLLDKATTRAFADRTLLLAERWAEERPEDPFARLLAARARGGHYRFSRDPRDVQWGVAWALSCLAMVEPKMLVYRTAAEVYRVARRYDEALALFDASEERGLADDELRTHRCEILVEAGRLAEAGPRIDALARAHPFDATVLGVKARYHAAAGDWAAWGRVTEMLRRLGYDTSALPQPPR